MVNKNEKIVYPMPAVGFPFTPDLDYLNLDENKENIEVELDDSYNKQDPKIEEEGKKKKWLVIHYGAGDNNLARLIFSDVDELEKVGSDANTHVVSVLDVGKWGGVPFQGARIFYLKQDGQSGKINSPIIKNLGQVNMADPVFMASVLKEIIRRFPAENIVIFIGDHGAGWEGAVEDDSAGGKFMKIGEIREALEEVAKSIGKKIDVLAFDACLMAMAEVGYELKNAVKYMVASEQTEGGGGYNYTVLFSKAMADAIRQLQSAVLAKIKVGPEELAKLIVQAAKEYSNDIETISAADLDKSVNLAQKINSFAETVLPKLESVFNNLNDTDAKKIKEKISKTQHFYGSFRDLKHFMKLIIEDKTISEEVRMKAEEVIKAIDDYLIAEFHVNKYPNAGGVTIELPSYGSIDSDYQKTLFAQDTKWDEMINKLNKA